MSKVLTETGTGTASPTAAWVTAGNGSGTVTQVNTANGVTGGPITSTGTIELSTIATLTLLANVTNGTAIPSSTTASALLDAAIASTQGDILYRGANSWAGLAPGTNGQFLKSLGNSANPAWAQPAFTDISGAILTNQITNANVTYPKIQNVGGVSLLGNPTGSAVAPSEITLGPGLAFAGSTLQSFGGSLVGAAGVAAGGTGLSTLTAHGVMLGEGTNSVGFATVGTAGRILTDQGSSADPSFGTTGLVINQHSGSILTHANTNGTVTLELSLNDWIKVGPVTGNFTLATANTTNGQQFTVVLSQQNGNSNFSVTWFSGITWIGAPYTAPAMPSTNSAILTATFKTTGTGAYLGWWLGNSAT